MRAQRLALLLAGVGGLASCSAAPGVTQRAAPTASATARASASPAGGAQIVPLADAAPRPLDLTLRPGLDDALAVAVFDVLGDLDGAARLLGPQGPLGPPLELEGEHVVTAASLAGAPVLVTSQGERLCVRTLDAARAAFEAPRCERSAATALATLGGTLALFELEPAPTMPGGASRPAPKPQKPAPKKPAPKPQRPTKPSKPSAKKPAKPPTKGPAKPPTKKPTGKPAPARAEPVRVLARMFSLAPSSAGFGERRDTGLSFERTSGGVDLVGAIGRDGAGALRPGFDLVFLERARKPGMGQLTLAKLDADAALERGGRTSLVEARLDFGALDGHFAPRLVGRGPDARLYTLAKKPVSAGKGPPSCAAISLASPLSHLGKPSPSAATCAFQPSASARLPDAALLDDAAKTARRHPYQPGADAPLGVLAAGAVYTLEAGAARSLGGALHAPLVAHRDAVRGVSFAPSGEALVALGERLLRLSPEGARVDAGAWPRTSPSRYVLLGASWALARGARASLEPAPTPVPDLVARYEHEGEARTVELELEAGASALVVRDARGRALGRAAPSPVGPGFEVIGRGARGALVVGELGKGRVALQVSPSGALGAPLAVGGSGPFSLELASHAGGEAVLVDDTHARWLDPEGRELARAAVPKGRCEARGLRSFVALPEPGRLVELAELAPGPGGELRCVVGAASLSRDGSLRAVTLRFAGLSRVAELVVIPRVASAVVAPSAPPAPSSEPLAEAPARACPRDMVRVGSHGFCIDRYESTLFDATSWRPLEHDHPPTPGLLEFARGEWSTELERKGPLHARALPLPALATWRRGASTEPHPLALRGSLPNGYVTGLVAEAACVAAGKRLCTHEEHLTACRGEADTLHPYGDDYEDGACNVFREVHPAAALHGSASVGHLDPRLPHVQGERGPLLRPTGGSPRCASRWGDDAAYDLVGNVDEWVELEGGAFAGGFYSRSTRNGCEALVTAHPRAYADYSTGVRCCRADASAPADTPSPTAATP